MIRLRVASSGPLKMPKPPPPPAKNSKESMCSLLASRQAANPSSREGNTSGGVKNFGSTMTNARISLCLLVWLPFPTGMMPPARAPCELRKITLLRGWVNRDDHLDPTPHLCFVAQVLFAELPLQVALLALDDPTLDYQQRYRQKKDGPQRVREASGASVDQRHGEVTGVASVTKGAFRGYVLDRLVGVGRRAGLAHGPLEPAKEQHPSAEQWPSEAACHRARQEAHREPPAQQQPEDQGPQVDQGRRRDDPRLVLLVAGHRQRPPRSRQDKVGNPESMMPPSRAKCDFPDPAFPEAASGKREDVGCRRWRTSTTPR